MRAILAATTLVLATAFAAPATAAAFTASGSFALGSPVAWGVLDACGNGGLTEGLDSNCVALPTGLDGLAYTLTATDGTGTLVEAVPCFYAADGAFIACGGASGTVSAGAAAVGIAALGGANVAWTFTVG